MALNYSIEHEKALIKVTVRGELDYLSMDLMWKDIFSACEKYDCFRILGIAEIDTPKQVDAYDHAGIFDAISLSRDARIAWVEKNAGAIEMAKLAETVLRNRGLTTGRVFGSVAEARRWLATIPNGL